MPDDRLFHPRLRSGAKVAALTYLERAVWEDLILGADDFGVYPDRAAKLRADNDAFSARESDETIGAAIKAVVAGGLFLRFEHQGSGFLCDPTLQDFQKIRYPRRTYYPAPSPEVFGKLSVKTQKLFRRLHHAFQKSSRIQSRPDHRLTANGLRRKEGGGAGEEGTVTFAAFYRRYPRKTAPDAAEKAWRAGTRRGGAG